MKRNIKFSIVIALAPWRSAEILESIKKLDYNPKKFETIIVKGLNVPENRNKGIKKSLGEFIIFLDDDALIEPDFLNKVERFFEQYPEISIVGGPQLTHPKDNLFAKTSGYVFEDVFSSPGINKRYKKSKLNLDANQDFISGVNMNCRKEVFKRIRFDKKLYPGDDVLFIRKAKAAGFKVAYAPEIYVYHRRRDDLKSLIKQVFDYAQVKPKSIANGEINLLFIAPTLFFIYLLILPLLVLLSNLFLLPLLAYVVLAVTFALYETVINKNIFALFLLPFLFFIVHITYGIGFLNGFVNKYR